MEGVNDEKLAHLLAQLTSLTQDGTLRWKRELGSAHRYARWKNNLLILGPAESPRESDVPRYLFITPFDSPSCLEINTDNKELGPALLNLTQVVEQESSKEPATDPFGLSPEELSRLVS